MDNISEEFHSIADNIPDTIPENIPVIRFYSSDNVPDHNIDNIYNNHNSNNDGSDDIGENDNGDWW